MTGRLDRPRTPKMNWAKRDAQRRGDTAPPAPDTSDYQVPEHQKGLGSWRQIGLRWPATCATCGNRTLMGLYNPRTHLVVCDRECLDTWRQARPG